MPGTDAGDRKAQPSLMLLCPPLSPDRYSCDKASGSSAGCQRDVVLGLAGTAVEPLVSLGQVSLISSCLLPEIDAVVKFPPIIGNFARRRTPNPPKSRPRIMHHPHRIGMEIRFPVRLQQK